MQDFLFAVSLILLSVFLLIVLVPIFGMFSVFIVSLLVFISVGVGLERVGRGSK